LEARYLAAVYACGEGALLSGRAAAHLLGILDGPAPKPEVTAPTERRVRGITTRRHRSTSPGAKKLRRVLHGEEHVTLSRLERRFLALLREAGLPLPVTNRTASGRHVDCRWPHHRLTVELDGYRYHSSRHAWELDRRREREAFARGDDFRRYTYGDVYEQPRQILDELRAILSRASPPDESLGFRAQ